MQVSHTLPATSALFDDPNLVPDAGLVPVLALAESAGLGDLADEHLTVPTDKGANAGLKVSSLVAGMVACADSIDDMARLRHGGMGRIFARAYAPSTLGSFLRAFTFGHVRQLDAVASRFLVALAGLTRVVGRPVRAGGGDASSYALLDVDAEVLDTVAVDKTHRHHAIIEQVHADLKSSALAHLPSRSFAANSAWLVLTVIAYRDGRIKRMWP